MTILIILFVISLVSLIIRILYKYWRLRTSDFPIYNTNQTISQKHLITSKEILIWRGIVWDQTKKYTHIAILNSIKTWIILVHITQKRLREKFPKVFKEKTEIDTTKPNSSFIKTISDFKTKIKRFKKKIKEQDL